MKNTVFTTVRVNTLPSVKRGHLVVTLNKSRELAHRCFQHIDEVFSSAV